LFILTKNIHTYILGNFAPLKQILKKILPKFLDKIVFICFHIALFLQKTLLFLQQRFSFTTGGEMLFSIKMLIF